MTCFSSTVLNYTIHVMNFEQWDWDQEGKEVNEYLLSHSDEDELDNLIDDILMNEEAKAYKDTTTDKVLEEFFKKTTPSDLNDIISSVMGKNKDKVEPRITKKDAELTLTQIAEKYELPLKYVIEEFGI